VEVRGLSYSKRLVLGGELDQAPADPNDKDALRYVLGRYATGATIVTASWQGQPHGLAVNSFTSVSLQPPMILFCPGKGSETWPAISNARYFAVNVLAAGQDRLCRKFAKKDTDRFADIAYGYSPAGCPVLSDTLAYLECEIGDVYEAGDHFVVLGHVLRLGVAEDQSPLVFYEGGFHKLDGQPDGIRC
jgi:3-hydroxy-9,10-secoandrosta-1,3,5(10)-triene-9,17-dione monooxygenase reductase component